MILILEGEESVGAKQNRIINRTNLIQGNSTTVIPVSCVEQVRASLRVPRENIGPIGALFGMKNLRRLQGEMRDHQAWPWPKSTKKTGHPHTNM